MTTNEPSQDSNWRPPPLSWLREAITYLNRQTYPEAPALTFRSAHKIEDPEDTDNTSSSGDWFLRVWDYLDKTSGGQTAEERLGEYAWVLDPVKVRAWQEFRIRVAPGLSEGDLTIVDSATATGSISTAGSHQAGSAAPSVPETAATSPGTSVLLSNIALSAARNDSLRASRLATLQGNSNICPPPPAYVTNAFNSWTSPGSNVKFIYPETHQTHMEKKNSIAKNLYRNLAKGHIDRDFCPVLGMNPSPPYNFIRISSQNGSGLHVFVDISNIYMGFINLLKLNRRIPDKSRVIQPAFAFTDFAAILERCRPTARRVLVGSYANMEKMPYHLEAEHCNYEVSLLERVYKARLSPAERRRRRNDTGPGSASDTAQRQGFLKNGEQCVDELLQMKMLESLIDTETPAILVLATGDAAVAEYSGGFAVNVERALQKGWKVEVVGWSRNMGQQYAKLAGVWADKLRIIYLDEMVEDLLAWYKPE